MGHADEPRSIIDGMEAYDSCAVRYNDQEEAHEYQGMYSGV